MVFGHNLFWYAAVFGTITAVRRAAVSNEPLVLEAERMMTQVVQQTHYLPKRWRGNENTPTVRYEFETLFPYTAMMWLEEMASIFLTPYLLIFVVPKMVEDILQFIADFTVNVEGVGHVCSFSAFDFRNHGNSKYGSPHDSSRERRSSQGKMEISFLSYPYWEQGSEGMQFLSNLRAFMDQQLRGPSMGDTHPHPPFRPWSPNRGDTNNRNSHLARETPEDRRHWGSLWLMRQTKGLIHTSLIGTIPPGRGPTMPLEIRPINIPDEHPWDLWDPSLHRLRNEENLFEGWMRSHPEASTSDSFPEQTVIQQHHSGNPTLHPAKNHWWARESLLGGDPHSSFPEPPDFDQQRSSDASLENRSTDRSSDGYEDQQLQENWRNFNRLSRTTGPKDELFSSGSEYKLLFDDIYVPPP